MAGGGDVSVAPPAPQQLGFWMTLALVMGTMIGSGVFLLPASLAPYGWNALYGWLITIGGATCLALVLARLVAAMPSAGGLFAIIGEAFGPLVAFVVAWAFQFGVWVGIAALASAAVSYASAFLPGIAAGDGVAVLAAGAIVWIVTGINLLGAHSAGRLQIAALLLKSLPLIAVGGLGLALFLSGAPATTPYAASDISLGSIAASAALCLWAMTGFEAAPTSQSRIANAKVVVPRALIVGALATGAIYIGISLAVIAYLPAERLGASNAPFADFIAAHWAAGPALLVALFAAISAIGSLNGNVIMGSEVPRDLADAGQAPRWLARSDACNTPRHSLLLSAGVVSGLLLLNASSGARELFTFMALLAASSTLVFYFACAAALAWFVLKRRIASSAGYNAAMLIGLAYSVWTFYGSGLRASGWTVLLVALGIPLYLLIGRQKPVIPAE